MINRLLHTPSYNRLGLLVLMVTVLVLLGSLPANATTRTEVKRMVVEEAVKARVPTALALALAKVESDFQAHAVSHAGARGVMQIMPATAKGEFGVSKDRLFNPRLNIKLGLRYLKQLRKQYGGRWDLALSHYNGGTLKGKGRRAIPHSYTQKYVASVLRWKTRYAEQARVWQADVRINRPGVIKRWTPKVREAAYRPRFDSGRSGQEALARRVAMSDPAYRKRLEKRLKRAKAVLDDFEAYLDNRG